MNEITFATEFEVALRSLAALEDEAKDAQMRRDEARAELYKAMEANDLKCVDTEYIKITRVAPTVSIVPDWKSFKFEVLRRAVYCCSPRILFRKPRSKASE